MNWNSLFERGFDVIFSSVKDSIADVGLYVRRMLARLQRQIMRYVLQLLFLVAGLICFILSIILFLTRFYSLDVVLFGMAVFLLYIVFMLGMIRD